MLLRLLYLAKRAYFHLKWLDFSLVFGRFGWLLKRCGLLPRTRRASHAHGVTGSAPSGLAGDIAAAE